MDRYCLMLLLLISINAAGQRDPLTRVVLKTGPCQVFSTPNPTLIDSIQFLLLPENKLITTVRPGKQRHWPMEIALSKGSYKLIYPNMFGQIMHKDCVINDDSVMELTICPDSLLAYPENTLAKLKQKDSLTIIFQSFTCFTNILQKLLLVRKNAGIEARLYGDTAVPYLKGGSVQFRMARNVLLSKKILSKQDSVSFIIFENELRLARIYPHCTTQEFYTIRCKFWDQKIQNDICIWDGFHRLTNKWFGEPYEYTVFSSSDQPSPSWRK